MSLSPGEHELGSPTATLRLGTHRQGLAAKAGHDLVLEAAVWHGNVLVPDEPDAVPFVTVEVDLRSLHVVEGHGGVRPLTEGDKDEIRKTMQKLLATHDYPTATFHSTDVRINGDHATLRGELSLAGQTHPLELHVRRQRDGAVIGHGEVVQSAWGIRPYTGLFGALKLRDVVDVDVSLPLPGFSV